MAVGTTVYITDWALTFRFQFIWNLSGEEFYDAEENFSKTIPVDDDENVCNDDLSVEDNSFHSLG